MGFIFLFGLIILNGIFAMSELAIVSANKARLEQASENGKQGATVAIKLAEDPNRFLSTVQIGITLIGIFAGAFGGSALTDDVRLFLTEQVNLSENVAEQISLGLIVLFTTYLSLVIGELVPKRIALSNPEQVSTLVARPMHWLSRLSAPLVWFLSQSTEFVARLLGVQGENSNFITDFEVIAMVREGMVSGEFDMKEHDMVKGALELDDMRVREIATPRTEVTWLNINDSQGNIRRILRETDFSAYIVADETIDNIVGVVSTKALLTHLITVNQINLQSVISEPFFIPKTAIVADVLDYFKETDINIALILDEYGSFDGLITLNDIVEQVLGDVDMQDTEPVQRSDGSWLIDGHTQINDIQDIFNDFELPENESSDYQTLGGFVLKRLGHIPEAGNIFDWHNYRIEVVDMDGKRVDKVLIQEKPPKN